jgi:O-succinylbenzoate synthase
MEMNTSIDVIEIYRVSMPLVYPFRTAYGDDSAIESVLVKMTSGNHYGWGEASPMAAPAYSPEWAHGAFLAVRDWLAPQLVGKRIDSGGDLQAALGRCKGNFFAKGSLDLAWWDLRAHQLGQPLWKLLGGVRPEIEVGADFGVMDHIDELLTAMADAVAQGFLRVKLKFRPGWDIEMVRKVRERFPHLTIHIDCNSGYSLADTAMFQALDEFHLAMIEQPLAHDDLVDHAKLQSALRTPICLDESITSLAKARKAIELRSCRWINLKPGRVGGLTPAIEIHNLCQKEGIPCWVGGMLESAVGASHCIALATLPNIHYPSDIFPSYRFYKRDLGQPEIRLSGTSRVCASTLSGIGCEPDPNELASHQVDYARLQA